MRKKPAPQEYRAEIVEKDGKRKYRIKPEPAKPREVWIVEVGKRGSEFRMGTMRFVECSEGAVVVTREQLWDAFVSADADLELFSAFCRALGLKGKK